MRAPVNSRNNSSNSNINSDENGATTASNDSVSDMVMVDGWRQRCLARLSIFTRLQRGHVRSVGSEYWLDKTDATFIIPGNVPLHF
jgi:hypothetical protein